MQCYVHNCVHSQDIDNYPPFQIGGILTPYMGTCNLQRTPGQSVIEFEQFDVLVSEVLSVLCM